MMLKLILSFIIGFLIGGMLGMLVMALANAASFDDMEWKRLKDEEERKENCVE
jgi:hypothetical protein